MAMPGQMVGRARAVAPARLAGGLIEALLQDDNYLQYASSAQKQLFARKHVLYSYKTIGAAATLSQTTFFDQGIGAATNKQGDTNLLGQGSRLGGSEMFVIFDIRVHPLPAQADYDVAVASAGVAFGQWNEIMQRNSFMNLTINRTKVIDTIGPLTWFPVGFGPPQAIAGSAASGGIRGTSWPQFGSVDINSVWVCRPFITILPDQNIGGDMNWTGTVPAGPTTAGKLGLLLGGLLIGPGA